MGRRPPKEEQERVDARVYYLYTVQNLTAPVIAERFNWRGTGRVYEALRRHRKRLPQAKGRPPG